MPKYWVQWVDSDGQDGQAIIEAPNRHAAADEAMERHGADEVLEVKEE